MVIYLNVSHPFDLIGIEEYSLRRKERWEADGRDSRASAPDRAAGDLVSSIGPTSR